MPLRIDRVDTEVDVVGDRTDGGPNRNLHTESDSALRERLRPILLEILEEELERLHRERG